ncbi:MAG: hypothetical protein ABJA78_17680 [Ferruginibacter sp.]
MKIKIIFAIALLLLINCNMLAQTGSKEKGPSAQPFNFIKVNVTALALKNYAFQYERIINRKFSFALGFRTMPSTGLPFKNQVVDALGADDPETKTTIENMRLSNFAVTPEFRFYVGRKGYGRGFYIAPFFRYAKFTTHDVTFTYQNTLNVSSTINLSGDITANTGGILFGIQKPLGKHLCIDLWLLGPHYGSGKGDFNGVSSKTLTPDEQNDLRQELNDIDIPLTDKKVTVTSNSASVNLNGPWGGVRSGISFGFRF